MAKLKVEDLERISRQAKKMMMLREGGEAATIIVHTGTCGIAAGARNIMTTLLDELQKRNLDTIILNNSGCAGMCSSEPMVTVERKGEPRVTYVKLTPEKILRILDEHVLGGKVVEVYALDGGSERV